MQGWKGCDQLQTNQTITLTDARDNNQYTVAKLLDGRCWMTQNLRLIDITITQEDSDINQSTFYIPKSDASTGFDYDQKGAWIDPDNQYGGSYNWYLATAGEGTHDKTTGDTSSSICPKKWKLPNETEARALLGVFSNLSQSPANFTINGTHGGGSRGQYAYYNLSTAYTGHRDNAQIIHYNRSWYVTPGTKTYGRAIRCIYR